MLPSYPAGSGTSQLDTYFNNLAAAKKQIISEVFSEIELYILRCAKNTADYKILKFETSIIELWKFIIINALETK